MKIAFVCALSLVASMPTSLALSEFPRRNIAEATATNGGGDVSANGSSSTMMATCNGDDTTLVEKNLDDSRDYIYCELVFNYAGGCGGDIYSTSPLAPCDVTWWNNLDVEALAAEFGAESVTKNGPQYWSMDTVKVKGSQELFDMAGADMNFGANLPPGTMGSSAYTVFYPTKTQFLIWKAGLPTYRLTDADGYQYVVQGYKVDKSDLATLGDQFQSLPEDWSYSVVTPDEDLVFNLTPDAPIPSVQDEFDQIYIRVPSDDTTDDTTSAANSNTVRLLYTVVLHVIFFGMVVRVI